MIGAHTGVSDTTERHIVDTNMQNRVIDARATGLGLLQYPTNRFPVALENIKRQCKSSLPPAGRYRHRFSVERALVSDGSTVVIRACGRQPGHAETVGNYAACIRGDSAHARRSL